MKRTILAVLACATVALAQAPNGTCATATQIFATGPIVSSNAGEPDALDTAGGNIPSPPCRTGTVKDVFFFFNATATGNHVFSTNNVGLPPLSPPENTDTVLQVFRFTGAPCASSTVAVGCNDDISGSNFRSTVTASLTAGLTYHVRVGSWSSFDPSGNFYLNVTEPPPSLVVTSTVTPATPVLSGSAVTIDVTVATSNGSPLNGSEAVTADTTLIGGAPGTPMTPLGGGLFQLNTIATGSVGAKNIPLSATNGVLSGTGSATVSIYVLANDLCGGALPLVTGANGPFDNTNTIVPNEPGFNTPCGVGGNVGGRDLFYTYTPACDGTVTMTTCGGNAINEPGALSDTQLVVYGAWTCGVGPGAPALACNDDAGTLSGLCGSSGFESTVSFPATAGTTYLVRVCGFGGAFGTFNVTVSISTAQIAVIGTGCGSPAATLAGSGAPVMGSTGTITVTAQPNANGVLLFSNPNTAMAYTPFGACTIYVENPGMGILLPIFTDGAGLWSLSATFPNDPAFDCVGWDFQALVIGAAGIELTNALRLIIGT